MRGFFVAIAACALVACSTVNGASARVTEGQALANAWASLDAAAKIADSEVKAGVLVGSVAATVSADLKTASALLTDATSVYNAGTDPTAQITAALVAIADVTTRVGALTS